MRWTNPESASYKSIFASARSSTADFCFCLCFSNPTGTDRMIFPIIVCISDAVPTITSLISSYLISVATNTIPQPISTPSALGMITSFVAITPPMGIPFPVWVSGIRHTHLCRKGRFDRLYACSMQLSSILSIPDSHAFMGNLVLSL